MRTPVTAPKQTPSVDSLVDVHQCLWRFLLRDSYIAGTCWQQEDEFLSLAIRLADVLESIDGAALSGWPTRVGRSLTAIVEAFDEVMTHWGWDWVRLPEPKRSEYVSLSRDSFRDRIERSRYEAAIRWQSQFTGPEMVCPVDDLADAGRGLGYRPTPGGDDPEATFLAANAEWIRSPRLGFCKPEIRQRDCDEPHEKTPCGRLEIAFNVLRGALNEIVPDRVKHPLSGETVAAAKEVIDGPAIVAEPSPLPLSTSLPDPPLDHVAELRSQRKRVQAALVEFMQDRSNATFNDVAKFVHDDGETTANAIIQNVARTNESLAELKANYRFRTASEMVFRSVSPE